MGWQKLSEEGFKTMKKFISMPLAIALAPLLTTCTSSLLNPGKPVTLTMRHRYSEQAESPMNRLADEFTRTAGLEKGIAINVTLMSSNTQAARNFLMSRQTNQGLFLCPICFRPCKQRKNGGEESLINRKEHSS